MAYPVGPKPLCVAGYTLEVALEFNLPMFRIILEAYSIFKLARALTITCATYAAVPHGELTRRIKGFRPRN